MAGLLSWAKREVSSIYHGINPLDHGQGWTSQAPAQDGPVRRPVMLHRPLLNNNSPVNIGQQQVHNPVARVNQPALPYHTPGIVKPIVNLAQSIETAPLGTAARVAAANITHNPIARQNAINQGKQAIAQSLNFKPQHTADGRLKANPNITAIAMGTEAGLPKRVPNTLKTTTGKVITKSEFNKMIPAVKGTPSISKEELANLTSKEQMAMHKFEQPLKAPEVNTAKNPFKANIPEVQPNDFGQVVANEQVASKPIQNAGRVWANHFRQLQKSNPNEAKNFWRYFNDPGYADAKKSAQLTKTLKAWRAVDDRIHGTSQVLGGNTNYLENHGLHPVVFNEDLTNHLVNGGNPDKFAGLHNLSRKHQTIAELEQAAQKGGFSVGTDPLSEGTNYINASAAALRRRAIVKGVGEADRLNLDKKHNLTLGVDNSIPISTSAKNELRGLQRSLPTDNRVAQGARTANVAAKSTLLSFGQFHPINISVLRASPTLAIPKPSTLIYRNAATGELGIDPTMSAHPISAAKGLYKTFRPLAPGGKQFAAHINEKAVADGTDLKAAKIGAPYNANFLDNSGARIAGVGHDLLGRQMLGMHDEAVRSVIKDLEKRGVSLDSPEARSAGKAVNNMMGFVNDEAQKLPPIVARQMGDWLLARQFTHSKFSQLRTGATTKGVAGGYARANVAANVIASTAIIAGLGYALKQKSDNARDALIRALTDPAIPTPLKDNRGNTVKLRIPGTDSSDVAKLLGIKPVRQADGHLSISWTPGNMPSTVSDYARARLAPFAGAGLKVATNSNYAGKPLYDPNAKFGTQAEQAATILGTGLLPIGLQGAAQTKAIESHLPGNVQDVLNANKPGGNPLVKSVGSAFGVTPTTDTTVGKGLESSRYFSALDQAKKGLNQHELDTINALYGSKKNPVTGKYDVQPNVHDSQRRASDLLDTPKALAAVIKMNQTLKAQGSKTDPLFNASSDQIKKVLEYQTMPPGGPDRKHWINQNKDWYTPLSKAREQFFSSLPKKDPNAPLPPLEYPSPSKQVAKAQDEFFKITDSAERAKFLTNHPEVQQQLDKSVEYNNNLRSQLGYSELDTFPKASPQVQKFIATYNALPKNDGKRDGSKTRAIWIQNHPKEWAAMTQYYTSASLYGLEQEASQAQFKDTGFSSKGLGEITNLAKYDIKQGKDKNGKPVYALTTGQSGGQTYTDQNGNTFADLGQANATGGSSGSGYSRRYGSKSGSGKGSFNTIGIKTAKSSKITVPKGVKVTSPKAPSFKSGTKKKLSTSKIPVSYKGKKL